MAVIPDSFVEDVARRFALLGDPTRLKIVSVLHEDGESTVGEIAAAAGTSATNASQHLQRPTARRDRAGAAMASRSATGSSTTRSNSCA